MDLKELSGFVITIVAVGMLLGAAILIFINFGTTVYEAGTVTNESFTMPGIGNNVTLGDGNWTSTPVIRSAAMLTVNATATVNMSFYPVEGVIQNDYNGEDTNICNATDTCYAAYTYRNYDTVTRSTMYDVVNATTPISSTWLPLIITIMVLAMIITIVVRSFGGINR